MKITRKLVFAAAILLSTVLTVHSQVKAAPESALAPKNLQDMRKEWGPFVGPWKRYDKNPVIALEGKETYSIQNGPQSVIQWKDKWYMFLMTSQPMVTKLAVSDDGLTWTRPHHDYLPDGLSPTELMERKLLTERGRAMYKIRGRTVESVFGQIKDVRGFDRFMQRGIEVCRGEWSLICATHNLLKLWRSSKACWILKKGRF